MVKKKPAKKKAKKPVMIAQNNVVAVVIIALLFGWVVGYVVGASADDSNGSSDKATSKGESSHSAHEMYNVAFEDAPAVQVLADADIKGGWNITLVTDNFEFTPLDVNGGDEAGTGHAHIYVDGEKIGRVYSNNYYLNALGEGDHEIRVSLNTNSHKDYAVGGDLVESTITVTETSHDDDTPHDESVPHDHN